MVTVLVQLRVYVYYIRPAYLVNTYLNESDHLDRGQERDRDDVVEQNEKPGKAGQEPIRDPSATLKTQVY